MKLLDFIRTSSSSTLKPWNGEIERRRENGEFVKVSLRTAAISRSLARFFSSRCVIGRVLRRRYGSPRGPPFSARANLPTPTPLSTCPGCLPAAPTRRPKLTLITRGHQSRPTFCPRFVKHVYRTFQRRTGVKKKYGSSLSLCFSNSPRPSFLPPRGTPRLFFVAEEKEGKKGGWRAWLISWRRRWSNGSGEVEVWEEVMTELERLVSLIGQRLIVE